MMRFKIGEIAKMTGISDSGIRFYEKSGIIAPDRQANSNYREYDLQDISILMGCKWYRACGFSVNETLHLNQETNPEELSFELQKRCNSIIHEINKKQWVIELMQNRAEVIESFQEYQNTCKIAYNPVWLRIKLWRPGRNHHEYVLLSEIPDWKDMAPFMDSCLKYSITDILHGQDEVDSDHGLAMEEKYARLLNYSPTFRVDYIASQQCVHTLVEVTDHLSIHRNQLEKVKSFIEENRLEVSGPVYSTRLFNIRNLRYDQLWIPIKNSF